MLVVVDEFIPVDGDFCQRESQFGMHLSAFAPATGSAYFGLILSNWFTAQKDIVETVGPNTITKRPRKNGRKVLQCRENGQN